MKVETDTKLDFNDVLIRPKRTKLSSRSEVNLEREICFPQSCLFVVLVLRRPRDVL